MWQQQRRANGMLSVKNGGCGEGGEIAQVVVEDKVRVVGVVGLARTSK